MRPYFALRSYTDACGTCGGEDGTGSAVGGPSQLQGRTQRASDPGASATADPDPDCPECNGSGRGHYANQIGSEPTPAEFIDALLAVTAECVRVLKPSGSLWVNLGDKYAGSRMDGSSGHGTWEHKQHQSTNRMALMQADTGYAVDAGTGGIRAKSLMGLPWRYALRCIDDLGLILRAEVIWSKPNGLPESVTDRVRRSHEQWFHFTREPRYFSAVDEIREGYSDRTQARQTYAARDDVPVNGWADGSGRHDSNPSRGILGFGHRGADPLGKLPGSVWTVPTEPLRVPDHLPQHFAAFPSEWPRRIILGWSPSGICTVCEQGRRPVVETQLVPTQGPAVVNRYVEAEAEHLHNWTGNKAVTGRNDATITGESCACPTPDAPTRPAVVLDPFSGTGTTVAVANALGRYGVGIDLSADYLTLARWRINDPNLRAKVLGLDKPTPELPGQVSLFG